MVACVTPARKSRRQARDAEATPGAASEAERKEPMWRWSSGCRRARDDVEAGREGKGAGGGRRGRRGPRSCEDVGGGEGEGRRADEEEDEVAMLLLVLVCWWCLCVVRWLRWSGFD
jgi:hypothetical protein